MTNDSLLAATNSWLQSVNIYKDPEWDMMSRLLRASAEALDANYQAAVASEYRKLQAHMTEYASGNGSDALDEILKRNER